MTTASRPEVWLRGALPEYAAALQPVAHGLLQVAEELEALLPGLDRAQLAARPGGAASIGYHVHHLLGSLDRLLTSAQGRQLSVEQLAALRGEAEAPFAGDDGTRLAALVREGITRALAIVRATPPEALTEPRAVGRAALPSTVGGLLFHATEHSARHLGQIVTTARVVRGGAA